MQIALKANELCDLKQHFQESLLVHHFILKEETCLKVDKDYSVSGDTSELKGHLLANHRGRKASNASVTKSTRTIRDLDQFLV